MKSVSTIERTPETATAGPAGPTAKTGRRAWPRVSERAIVCALVVLNLSVTLPLAFVLNVWVDEAYTLHTTADGVAEAWRRALTFELQPPLYFALLGLWRGGGGSIFFARLFSVAAVALTIPVAAAVSRRYAPRAHAGWLAALVALNPFAVWAATEIRVYALALLLSALLLLLFSDAHLAPATRPRAARALYVLVCVVALYTHYYLGFLLAACGCALVVFRRRALSSYLLDMTLVGVSFAPLALRLGGQVSTLNNSAGRDLTPPEVLKLLYVRLHEYALPFDWLPSQNLKGLLLRLGPFVLLAAFALLIRRSRRRQQHHDGGATAQPSPFVAPTVAASLALLFTLPLLSTGEAFAHARHTTALFLPALLALVTLLASVEPRRLLPACALAALAVYAVALVHDYAPPAKTGDWRRVAAYLEEQEAPGQPVLVFRASAALALAHHYRGPNVLVPLPRPADLGAYDLRAEVIRDEREVAAALARVGGANERLWLVTQTPCRYLDLDYNCAALESHLARHYATDSTQRFRDTEVRLLKKRTGD